MSVQFDPRYIKFSKVSTGPSSLLTGLKSYFKFDETSGTTIYDAVNNTSLPTFSGCTTPTLNQTGKISKAIDFNALDNCFGRDDTPASFQLGDVTAMSVSFWFKLDALPSARGTSHYFFDGMQHSTYEEIYIKYNSSNTFAVMITPRSNGSAYEYLTTSNLVTVGVWTHFCFVLPALFAIPKMYVNGVDRYLSKSNTLTVGTYLPTFGYYWIGNEIATGQRSPDGMMTEFGMWSRALSDSEALSLYNSNNGLAYPFS